MRPHKRPQEIVAVLATRLADGRGQQFPGVYLSEDVRAGRGANAPSNMLREGLRS